MMDRKKTDYCLLIFLAAVLLFSGITGAVRLCSEYIRKPPDSIKKIQMEMEGSDGEYYYRFTLPDTDVSGREIAYNTSHFSSDVYIDGQKVYECIPADVKKTKSTGYRWNFVELYEGDTGKEVVFHFVSPYKNLSPEKTLYYGETNQIYRDIIKMDGIKIVLSVTMFVIGLLLFLYSVFILKFDYANSLPVFFSAFSMFLSVWIATGSKLMALMVSGSQICTIINQYALMIFPVAFLQFLRQVYIDRDIIHWDIMEVIGAVIIIIRTVLDFFNVYELRETLLLSQIYISLVVIFGVVLGMNEFRKYKLSNDMRLNVICLVGVLVAAFMQVLLFRFFKIDSVCGLICVLVYICITTVNFIIKSIKIRERANEAELYKKLAYTDELTGVYNRTAFRNDLDKQSITDSDTGEIKILPNVIFMFDLNDLKKCNDQFGHENGDYYIRSVAHVIRDAFGVEGRCYRIGGDEFCAMMLYKNQSAIDNILNVIQNRVHDLNRKKFVVEMSVSAGYAVYDPNIDSDLDKTMKRADSMMYENKQALKKNRLNK